MTEIMMKEIHLTQGRTAIVDDEDFDWLNQWFWHFDPAKHGIDGYAVRTERISRFRRKKLWMHRIILGSENGVQTDHKNGNKLDNRRANLRCTDEMGNMQNRNKFRGKYTSQYKGVTARANGSWCARIMIDWRAIHIGYFDSEIGAARAYNEAAIRYHGEFANLNVLQ